MSDKIDQRLRLADKALRAKNHACPDFPEDGAHSESVTKDDARVIRLLSTRAPKKPAKPPESWAKTSLLTCTEVEQETS